MTEDRERHARLRPDELRRREQDMTGDSFDRVERLSEWAGDRGRTILDLAFAWLLAHAPVASVIAGATTPTQVRANAASADWRLTPADLATVDDLLTQPV